MPRAEPSGVHNSVWEGRRSLRVSEGKGHRRFRLCLPVDAVPETIRQRRREY